MMVFRIYHFITIYDKYNQYNDYFPYYVLPITYYFPTVDTARGVVLPCNLMPTNTATMTRSKCINCGQP